MWQFSRQSEPFCSIVKFLFGGRLSRNENTLEESPMNRSENSFGTSKQQEPKDLSRYQLHLPIVALERICYL